jgi:hypothetical protein
MNLFGLPEMPFLDPRLQPPQILDQSLLMFLSDGPILLPIDYGYFVNPNHLC